MTTLGAGQTHCPLLITFGAGQAIHWPSLTTFGSEQVHCPFEIEIGGGQVHCPLMIWKDSGQTHCPLLITLGAGQVHLPLETTPGAGQMHSVGSSAGLGAKPFPHVNAHTFLRIPVSSAITNAHVKLWLTRLCSWGWTQQGMSILSRSSRSGGYVMRGFLALQMLTEGQTWLSRNSEALWPAVVKTDNSGRLAAIMDGSPERQPQKSM